MSEETDIPFYRRWQNAQLAEKEFWRSHSDRHLNSDYWSKMLHHGFDLELRFFTNKDVLEIGCGPSGIIHFISEAKTRCGLEPMDMSELLAQESSKLDIVRKGVAENIPFGDGSFDIIICFNVLDHCYDPLLVIKQCSRVLRGGGTLLLWVHALRGIYRVFQRLLNKLDPPHPNHFTTKQITQIVGEYLRLDRMKRIKGAGFSGHEPTNGNPKIAIANYLTENVWFIYKKSI